MHTGHSHASIVREFVSQTLSLRRRVGFFKIWHLVEPYINNQSVVAHNGMSFDFPVLAQTLAYYDMEVPEYEKHCTYRLFGSNLAALCLKYNIPLNHHEALSDARACAALYLKHLSE